MKMKMGRVYKDSISGWVGTATAKIKYLNGCVRWQLDGANQDGKPTGYIFDEQQIVEVDTEQPVTVQATAGGPRDHTPLPR